MSRFSAVIPNEQTPITPICEMYKNSLSGFILIAFAAFWAFTSSAMCNIVSTHLTRSISDFSAFPFVQFFQKFSRSLKRNPFES